VGIEDIASLTSKDRILLYLSDYPRMEDRYELPSELTQESIARSTGVQRKHLPQYLKDLMGDGLVIQRKAHIKDMKQRMNGYYLSPGGFVKSAELRDCIGNLVVAVTVNGKAKSMMVKEIDEATSIHITYCDIVTEAVLKGVLDMASLEKIESRRLKAIERKDEATDAYRRALATVWRDGKVTATERFLIEELRSILKVSVEQHGCLEAEIVKKLASDHVEFLRIYGGALEIALYDGHLAGPEVAILENLRKTLRISVEEHNELVNDIRYGLFGPPDGRDADGVGGK
jgi:tellurite resistance protein